MILGQHFGEIMPFFELDIQRWCEVICAKVEAYPRLLVPYELLVLPVEFVCEAWVERFGEDPPRLFRRAGRSREVDIKAFIRIRKPYALSVRMRSQNQWISIHSAMASMASMVEAAAHRTTAV